jgi:hypothetical protein
MSGYSAGEKLKIALLAVALGGLFGGLLLAYGIARPELATIVWALGVGPVLAALLIEILHSLRRGEVGARYRGGSFHVGRAPFWRNSRSRRCCGYVFRRYLS